MTFERENLKWLGGYVPGEQPRRAKAKLNTNENPFPPCDAVLRVLAGIDGEMLRQYPDLTAQAFRAEAARLHGLIPDNIRHQGGDELLRLALTTFLPTGSPLGLAEPSYSLYPVLAAVHDSPICAPSTRLCGPCFSSEAMVAFADIPFFFNVSLDQTEGDSQYPDFRNVQ